MCVPDLKYSIAAAYNSLRNALVRNEQLRDAVSKHKKSLEMCPAIFGNAKPYPAMAASLGNIGSAYGRLGKSENVLQKHKECLEMNMPILTRLRSKHICTLTGQVSSDRECVAQWSGL